MPARKPRLQQVSFGEEFMPEATTREPELSGDRGGTRRVEARRLESAAGIVHQPPDRVPKIVLDNEGKVVEGHLLWAVAIDERRCVAVEQQRYLARQRFEALCGEVDTSAGVRGWTAELVLQTVLRGREAELSEQQIARRLKISRSHVSRLIRRSELNQRHRSFLESGLSISYLEAVSSLAEARQVELLTSARDEGWTVRQLERHVREDELGARRVIGINPLLIDCLEDVKLGRLVPDWKDHPDEWCDHLRRVAKMLDERPHLRALLVPRGSRRTA